MKAIIIFGSMIMSVAIYAQQQQQRQQAMLVNNLGNSNFLSNVAFNNIQVQSNIATQAQVRHVTRAVTINNNSQVHAANVVRRRTTTQVRRRTIPRPRPIAVANITPSNNDPMQVLNNPATTNVFASNEINAPVQNFIVVNTDNIQWQGFSNMNKSDANSYTSKDNTTEQKDLNFNLNLKVPPMGKTRSAGSGSSSASHSKVFSFNKKAAKFKRHFFGKISSHKKGRHRLDICFNWKN